MPLILTPESKLDRGVRVTLLELRVTAFWKAFVSALPIIRFLKPSHIAGKLINNIVQKKEKESIYKFIYILLN